ncbi:beta-ketoacyl synthase N-terminal-like domain-containing protein [Dactylosporangium matsuzakiense]|uniref:3-oxoacyl-ACP synthase n=1 Tax=Dactylosporangium matsuzakiense TaxID=53360 RepID=A0A9W6KEJ0_9ACTN|nr:beta-ketoacyl synthase N-terminal-like domain-containing protein [Dactylosporangium matsuzakiense]UWZ42471.1 hypothetical protein Dmats_33570 [Dactylosporangium matsuzakiense]GLL00616.1 3-oxoacyl-ACP synthase [Dactylosporangium matsuzakiense]
MSRPVVSAWTALSAYGLGAEPFTAGLRSGVSGVRTLEPGEEPVPLDRAALIPDFSAKEHLGAKGTRSMDRVTAIAVALVGQLLKDAPLDPAASGDGLGLVLGTGSGSVQSIMDFTRDSLTGEKPYRVDPARFPNTVMNRAAGQSAIWYHITGPNATIAGGWLTGLLALAYAVRLWRGGHCRQVLTGAAEEYSVQRSWLEYHGRAAGEPQPLGEGGALLLLEDREAATVPGGPVAEVLGTRFMAFHADETAGDTLAACVRAALADAGADAADVELVAPLGLPGRFGEHEQAALRSVFGGSAPAQIRASGLVGDGSAAAGALQIAALLATAGDAERGRVGLVTGLDPAGTVGCALFRFAEASTVEGAA